MSDAHSLTARTLRLAIIRIGLVALVAGLVSYFINQSSLEKAVRSQLLLSTEQTLQRESLPFNEIRELQQNFLADFRAIDTDPTLRQKLISDFALIFYRHADGSYTQRPDIFEGKPLADGRRFANMSATYAPDIPPDDDIKARFALSFLLSHQYGTATRGRLFNFYGVVPEKGFPIYQNANIANVFVYSGADALKLETYEFYARGFGSAAHNTFMTRMYFDYTTHVWMTTVATPDVVDATGKHRILACVDVPLDELMHHLARPAIAGTQSTLFMADADGTLMFHTEHMEAIKKSEGQASIKSQELRNDFPLLAAAARLAPGKVSLIDTPDAIVAVGRLPETPAVLAIHYPRSLLRPAILQNLAIIVSMGLLTLLVELFVIRTILLHHVAEPLARLTGITRRLGASSGRVDCADLPTASADEIGELARDFASMTERIQDAHEQMEAKVQERTHELAIANQRLAAMSLTDGLTGIANRRHFDQMLQEEWQRARRNGSYLSLCMLDVDSFKKYNDHYGHQAGDDCLIRIAHLLQTHSKRAGDFIARYGGEEFAIIAVIAAPEQAQSFADAICQAVAQLEIPHATSALGKVTVSIGIAGAFPSEGKDATDLLRQADAALYQAKKNGRNRAVVAV